MRLVLLLTTLAPLVADAHNHMLLPDKSSVKVDEPVTIVYQFGHPFEAALFDAEKPLFAKAFLPDATSIDLLPSFEKTSTETMEFPPTIERNGKKERLIRRASLWVNVEGYPSKKGDK